MNIKRLATLLLALILTMSALAACGESVAENNADTAQTEAAQTYSVNSAEIKNDLSIDIKDVEGSIDLSGAKKIALNGASAEADDKSVEIDGGKVKITSGGVYRISGSLSDGQIKVKTEKDDESVVLALDNADITNSSGAAIHIKNALSAYVVALSGTTNKLADTENYEFAADDTDGEPDATIFSKTDLVIAGKGALSISANYSTAIKSKDNLLITDTDLGVTSVDDGIKGRDSLEIAGGKLTVTAANDGVKTTNDQDAGMGNLIISGGNINITSGTDGVQSENTVSVTGGEINIKTADGAAETTKESFGNWGGSPMGKGFGAGFPGGESGNNAESTDTASAKGVKAANTIEIFGGKINIDGADDAVHSNGSVNISGGELTLASSDDGVHADSDLTVSGGSVEITQCYEGLEGQTITVSNGDIRIKSSDDGFNAAGGNDNSQQGGFGGGDPFTSDDSAMITVSGGKIYINADGDGFDSNGSASMSGGEMYIDGPTNSGNGALDFGGEFVITGGTLIAAGASGMAECPAESSTQTTIQVEVGSQSGGSELSVKDSSGKEIISYAPAKAYENVVISSPELRQGETYTVYVDGSEATTIKAESVVTSQGGGMGSGMGRPGGNMGGDMPNAPGGMSPPNGGRPGGFK